MRLKNSISDKNVGFDDKLMQKKKKMVIFTLIYFQRTL